jgi:hypothetical protein
MRATVLKPFLGNEKVYHKFKIGDTVSIPYSDGAFAEHTIEAIGRGGDDRQEQRSDPAYRWAEGGWDTIAFIDENATLVVPPTFDHSPYQVGDVLFSGWSHYKIVEVDETKHDGVVIRMMVDGVKDAAALRYTASQINQWHHGHYRTVG